jgi:glycolate oxidase iron-sulfur subunit
LTELPEATWCCGAAGIYAITQPEQAELLLKRKVANIMSTGAEYVAAANPGCQLQIARGLEAAGARVEVVHPISLLARAYRRQADPLSATPGTAQARSDS